MTCPACHNGTVKVSDGGGWCATCGMSFYPSDLEREGVRPPEAPDPGPVPGNPFPKAPAGRRRFYVVRWQRFGCPVRSKVYKQWPAAARFVMRLEDEKVNPKRRRNVRGGSRMSDPVDWVRVEPMYLGPSYAEALVEDSIECGCGCGTWFYPPRADARFLNATHRKRAQRARGGVPHVTLPHNDKASPPASQETKCVGRVPRVIVRILGGRVSS